MTSAMFVVCWVLIHQPVAGQENCTPALHYYSAQAVMGHVLRTGDSLKISMSLDPVSAPVAPQAVDPDAYKSSKAEEKDR